jgi:hypothetical protein
MSDEQKVPWEALSRNKIAQQPTIKDSILESLRKNPSKSFDRVSADIGHWCSGRSIASWFKNQSQASFYVDRILPLLSTEQKQKHLSFAQSLQNHWHVGAQKFLWIHYDEKWFWGYVGRTNSKKCEGLGLPAAEYKAYHKSHINKVMIIAFVAYAFKKTLKVVGMR